MGGGRKQPTQQDVYKSNTRLMNMFSVLAETDSEEEETASDSESSDSDTSVQETHRVEEVQQKQEIQEVPSPQFRVWKGDDSRFSSIKNNVFSSPFSRKKPRRFAKEDEGWTSIQVGTTPTYSPLTQPSESHNDMPQLNLPPIRFPSLLNRGASTDMSDGSEEQTALAWAEKVKLTLERAGQGRSEMKRAASKSDTSGSISFFRRSIVLDETL